VVRNEFEMVKTARSTFCTGTLWRRHIWRTAYGRPVIGNKSDVEAVPMDNLRASSTSFYQPDNAVLTICGQGR